MLLNSSTDGFKTASMETIAGGLRLRSQFRIRTNIAGREHCGMGRRDARRDPRRRWNCYVEISEVGRCRVRRVASC